jgi:hypothetical protein
MAAEHVCHLGHPRITDRPLDSVPLSGTGADMPGSIAAVSTEADPSDSLAHVWTLIL